MWKLGDIEIKGKTILAPMAGVTSRGYREFMHQFGVSVSYTEMVSDMGLIYGNEETQDYITFDDTCSPCGIQLFGHDPESIAKAALIAETYCKTFEFFDVNMGCPVPKVTKTGAGSSLMKNPKLAGDIIRAIKRVTEKPVTAKIRLGWDIDFMNYMDVINELEDAGVAMISIHARTARELYYGKPHYDIISGLRKKMTVPLAVSGNIYTLDDAINAMEVTGADAVMIARGGIGNPFLIKQIETYYLTGERLESPSLETQLDYCLQLCDFLIQEKGEDRAMRIYRGIASRFVSGIPNARKYKQRMSMELVSRESLAGIIDDIKNELKS